MTGHILNVCAEAVVARVRDVQSVSDTAIETEAFGFA